MNEIRYKQAQDTMLETAALFRSFFEGLGSVDILVELVGSCAIQEYGNDIDVMIFVPVNWADKAAQIVETMGYEEEQGDKDEYGDGDFRSFRKGPVNILLVWEARVCVGWMASVEMCRYVGATTREQRVAIHRIIMDGCPADEVTPWAQ